MVLRKTELTSLKIIPMIHSGVFHHEDLLCGPTWNCSYCLERLASTKKDITNIVAAKAFPKNNVTSSSVKVTAELHTTDDEVKSHFNHYQSSIAQRPLRRVNNNTNSALVLNI